VYFDSFNDPYLQPKDLGNDNVNELVISSSVYVNERNAETPGIHSFSGSLDHLGNLPVSDVGLC
jgi:hypothetical protein